MITEIILNSPLQILDELEEIHKDVQANFHDQWDWIGAAFYVEA